MKFFPTPIAGAFLVKLESHSDTRGSFARIFCKREFAAQGIHFEVVQSNLAHNRYEGIVRGLHYQPAEAGEQKLVRCTAGAVLDVIVDMRPDSATKHAVFQIRLDSENRFALFIPAGVAHGYQVLESATDFMYLTDQYYRPGVELGVRYSDPRLGVNWPLPARDVTDRDASWPLIQGE